MTNRSIEHKFELNPLETNVFNEFQGEFKVSLLDLDLLEYGLTKDPLLRERRDNLVITCLDQVQNDFRFTHKGKIIESLGEIDFSLNINTILGFRHVGISKSDESKNLQLIY